VSQPNRLIALPPAPPRHLPQTTERQNTHTAHPRTHTRAGAHTPWPKFAAPPAFGADDDTAAAARPRARTSSATPSTSSRSRAPSSGVSRKVPYYTAAHTTPHINLNLNKNRETLRQRKLLDHLRSCPAPRRAANARGREGTRRGPPGLSPDRESAMGNAPALAPGPPARLEDRALLTGCNHPQALQQGERHRQGEFRAVRCCLERFRAAEPRSELL
jgi:hypothetical protein